MDQATTTTPETPSETAPESPAAGAPEAYAEYTLPEGITADKPRIDAANAIFKELGLTQAQAQRLIEHGVTAERDIQQRLLDGRNTMIEDWRNQVAKDPEIGRNLDATRAEIGRMWDKLGGPNDPVVKAAKDAFTFTGAGDHPALVKMLYRLSKLVNEGTHVSGGPVEVSRPNGAKPTMAAAVYPNLPSSSR